jgi:alpha-2-macroglobulin
MRRLTVLTTLVAAAFLSMPFNLFAQEPTPERVLRVVETSPLPGEEYVSGMPVVFFFDAALDCATATEDVLDTGIPGELTCEGSSLTFTPEADLRAGESFDFVLSDALRSADGAPLAEPYTLTVHTRGFLEVTSVTPAEDSSQVEAGSTIIVAFNRPVVPLTTLDAQAALPQPLTFDPPLSGTGRWINTSVYEFIPDEGLAGGTDYTVTVSGLTAQDGAPLAGEFTFAFFTQNPQVTKFAPVAEASGVPLTQAIQMTFNQPMDRASTEEAFFLNIQEIPGEIPGTFEWNGEDTGFMFTPDERLFLATGYTYGFEADQALNASQSESLAPFGINFYTAPFPVIVNTYPTDGATNVRPYGGFSLYFTSKMNPETLLDKITIEPAPENEPDAYFSEWNNQYDVLFPLEAETEYTISIAPGMEDVYGNRIDAPLTFSFVTGAQDPELSLAIPYNGIGLYDADRETTELYVTHMNVSEIDLELYSVDTSSLVGQLQGEEYYRVLERITNQPNTPVKSWTLDGADLRNVRRLDLVNVGEAGTGVPEVNGVAPVNCPGAMPSRANVGDRAQIITDPDPTRARSAPVNGEILELMYKDYAFTITGGPDCREGIVWWQIELREGGTAWVAEGLNGEYFFEVTGSAGTTAIPLADITLDGGPLPVGVYLLRAQAPEFSGSRHPISHIMLVSDTALLMKRGIESTVVWVNDIHTGTPAAGVTVTLVLNGENLTSVSDESGVATFIYPRIDNLYDRAVVYVDDGERFGITTNDWADGLYPYQFNIDVDTYPSPYRIYMYTDRPVYRPGQPVHFKGIVRAKRDNDYLVPDSSQINITIYNSNYEAIDRFPLDLNEYGTFASTFTLDEGASLGYYRIEGMLPETLDDNVITPGIAAFDVAEYRLPEFQVEVAPRELEVMRGDTIVADIDVSYFFGGPVSDADVSYYVSNQGYFFDYQGQGNYSFSAYDPESSGGSGGVNIAEQGVTGADGMLTIEVPADTGTLGQSRSYMIEAVASDESGQSVSGRAEVVIHQGELYVGIGARDFIGAVGQPVNFDLITVDWDSVPVPGQTVQIDVIERRWNSVQEMSEYNAQIVWKSEIEDVPVTSAEVTTDAEGRAEFSFEPPNGGYFIATATVRDSQGNRVRASSPVWVTGGDFIAWQQSNATTIQVVTDKTSYQVGDTAELLIASPFMGRTEALITLERDGVLRTEHITLESNSTVYTIEIEEDFAPTVYVGVVLFKGVDANNPVADMRVGYATLSVDNERLALNLDIVRDTELAGPRDTVTYTITATDYTGAPVQAELSVALTDLASLSLGNDYTGPILDFFYGMERLSLLMSSGMVLNTDLITQFTRDVVKGGGGGGGEGFGILELREDFIDTAFWEGQLETDENGVATVTITLPDNLTTWRLNVRGVTDGASGPMLVGQETDDLVATKPLIVRPVAPRFFTVGDQVSLAAVVNNNTPEELAVDVALEASGVTFTAPPVQQITIPANGRGIATWVATVEDVEAVELVFAATAGDISDATRPQFGQGDDRLLPVYRYEVPEFVGTGGVLREASARVESVVLPRRYEVTDGTLTVEVEPSLAVAALRAIKAFDQRFSCECIEATASRLIANVAGLRALEALGDASDPRIETLRTNINLDVQRLIAQQKVDGGWGWFSSLSSDPLTTAWALISLTEAQEVTTVFPGTVENATMYLLGNLTTGTRSNEDFMLNRSAIIVYALSQANVQNLTAPISNLFDLRDRLSIYAKALLLGAILETQPDSAERVTSLRDELLNAVIVSANGAHWEEETNDWYNWNSNTRTTAMVLRVLLQADPDNPLLPNAVRWLMVAREADAWETTQETAWSLLALTDWMTVTGETEPNFAYTVEINGEEAAAATLTPADAANSVVVTRDVSELNADGPNPVEFSRTEGSGALYYTAYLEAYLPVPEVQPVDNGLTVSRVYRKLGSDEIVTSAVVGELVEVTVTLIAPNELNFVVLEDPLPAGLEAVDTDLATAQQTDTGATFENTESAWWSYWWADVQYYDEKVVLSADYVAPGTYEFTYVARATVSGQYSVIPTTAREFYFPEVYGRGAGSQFSVLPEPEVN